jgi:hypothetical protein
VTYCLINRFRRKAWTGQLAMKECGHQKTGYPLVKVPPAISVGIVSRESAVSQRERPMAAQILAGVRGISRWRMP